MNFLEWLILLIGFIMLGFCLKWFVFGKWVKRRIEEGERKDVSMSRGGSMNKKQFIVLWVMGIIISIALFSNAFWDGSLISFIFAVLIIGSLFMYTLHLYPQFSFLKLFKIIGGSLLIVGIVWGTIIGVEYFRDWQKWSKIQSGNFNMKWNKTAMPWTEIKQDPEFISLSEEQQSLVKQKYWNKVIVPSTFFVLLPERKQEIVRQKFWEGDLNWEENTNENNSNN